MKDNITALYKKAGIEPDTSENAYLTGNYNKLPEFSAEKQIELIRLVGIMGNVCICQRFYVNYWAFTTHHKDGMSLHEDFSQALAGLILQLWDEFTGDQIKEIERILR